MTSKKRSSHDDGVSPEEEGTASPSLGETTLTTRTATDKTKAETVTDRRSVAAGGNVEWFTDALCRLLQRVVAKRNGYSKASDPARKPKHSLQGSVIKGEQKDGDNHHVVNEIIDFIEMPEFAEPTAKMLDPTLTQLGSVVREQLKQFVSDIASSYRDNAFHNFEHACHMAMSATKILNEILVQTDEAHDDNKKPVKRLKVDSEAQRETHDATFGISSDPLMQFVILFAALIHDVDHSGLTNQQLINSHDPLATQYLGRSVAEQHSIRFAWGVLMADQFVDLRDCIYQTEDEQRRFRQLVINAVIATDIADAKLQTRRQALWIEAFQETSEESNQPMLSQTNKQVLIGRKAILIFELIIQASDSAHTMQPWPIYQKWNRHLFDERYTAHVQGKVDVDPSLSWYKDELWFVDNYVLPLAKSFQKCRASESLSADLVNCTLSNRQEWEEKGEMIAREMV